jgi:hypothetical protein
MRITNAYSPAHRIDGVDCENAAKTLQNHAHDFDFFVQCAPRISEIVHDVRNSAA